ncbi:MAG TPA: HlyD family secretion protein [Paludibaculum sp.]|jgi:membrane fusion protein (multidrug efflux system)
MISDLNEAPTPRRSPATGRIVAAVVILVILCGAGYGYWTHAAARETTDDAQVEGRIHAVSPRVGGTVTKVLVENNQIVQAGAVLFEIENKDYQVALERAKADLAEAEGKFGEDSAGVPVTATATSSRASGAQAGVGEVQAAITAAESQVQAAQARKASAEPMVKAARANADRAAADLERMKTLLAKDEVSRQQYDTAFAAAEATRAQLEAAQAQVSEAAQGIAVARSLLERERSRMPRTEAEIAGAKAGPPQVAASRARASAAAGKVAQMKALVEAAQLSLERTVIRAPASGIIGQKNLEVGQIVQPGQPLMAVVAIDDVWVVANFKENQLANIRPGQKVELEVDAFGGRQLRGTVHSIAGATGARFSLLPPENATGNYVKVVQRIPVKIVFDPGQDPNHQLRPGVSVVSSVLVK